VDTVDDVDSVEVVDTGVKTNLVHDGDAGGLGLLVQLLHGGGDVGGGDDVLLGLDGGFDDGGVEGVRDEGDGHVMLGDGGLEGGGVVDIEADGLGVGIVGGELLGRGEGAAGDGDVDAGLGQELDCGLGDEAGAEEEGGLVRHDGRRLSWACAMGRAQCNE
jgi:hypothetical protein